MRELWQRYAGRFDGLTLRERLMVSAAALVALLALCYTLLVEPEIVKQRRISGALLQKHSEMKALDAQIAQLLAARAASPQSAERQRLGALRDELAELEARIAAEERRLTVPAQMRAVMEGVLARSRGVELVELKSLPASALAQPGTPAAAKPAAKPAAPPLAAKPPASAPGAERLIYRHGLELTVSGSYLDLLAYLRDLEALPTQLYWGALALDAAGYPKLVLKLTVYTLSLDRAWLHV